MFDPNDLVAQRTRQLHEMRERIRLEDELRSSQGALVAASETPVATTQSVATASVAACDDAACHESGSAVAA